VPRVRAHFGEIDRAPEVHPEAAAARAGIEEEVGPGLVLLTGPQPVDDGVEWRAVRIAHAIDEPQHRPGAHVILHRRRHARKREVAGGCGHGLAIDRDLDLRRRGHLSDDDGREQNGANGHET